MTNCEKLLPHLQLAYPVLVAGLILMTTLLPFAPAEAAEPITLEVDATRGLPHLHHSALSRFIAEQMAKVGLSDWHFEPGERGVPAPNRVEWVIRLNAYAGGEVRNFARPVMDEQTFGNRPITVEARLYLDGAYQTLVESQAIMKDGGDADDFNLAEAVASTTQRLLGPSGAYYAIESGQRRCAGIGAHRSPC
jgi:hypothetical protein